MAERLLRSIAYAFTHDVALFMAIMNKTGPASSALGTQELKVQSHSPREQNPVGNARLQGNKAEPAGMKMVSMSLAPARETTCFGRL